MTPSPLLCRVAAIADANIKFERAMIELTSMIGGSLEDVTNAFKQWAMTMPYSGWFLIDYCLDRARRGKSLPFTVNADVR